MISLAIRLDGLGSPAVMGISDDGLKSFGEIDEEAEVVEVTDELEIVGLMDVELDILGFGVTGLGTVLSCGVWFIMGEVLVVGVFIVGAVVRTT